MAPHKNSQFYLNSFVPDDVLPHGITLKSLRSRLASLPQKPLGKPPLLSSIDPLTAEPMPDTLKTRLWDLSQDLFLIIYEETFKATPGPRCISRRKVIYDGDELIHKPFHGVDSNHLFHVDRQSRELYAKSFYNETFIFGDFESCTRFIELVEREHLGLIKELVLHREKEDHGPFDGFERYELWILQALVDEYPELDGKRFSLKTREEINKEFGGMEDEVEEGRDSEEMKDRGEKEYREEWKGNEGKETGEKKETDE